MLPSACGLGQHFQALGHSFSPYEPPSRTLDHHLKSGPLLHESFSNKAFADNPLEAASEGFRLLPTYLHWPAVEPS